MRPARKGPENPQRRIWPPGKGLGFNEAGPQGAGKPSAALSAARYESRASMRPARKGPENRSTSGMNGRAGSGFNEAGPQGAGKPVAVARVVPPGALASMRPARKGPENRRTGDVSSAGREASMRPARKGPENHGRTRRRTARGRACFNEAGPQGAGKPQCPKTSGRVGSTGLQ